MVWIEVRLETTEEAADAISDMLTTIGAGGVVIEDPNDIRKEIEKPGSLDYADDEFMQSLGEHVVIKAYFSGDRDKEGLLLLIREKLAFISGFLDVGKGLIGHTEVNDQDWSTAWKKYYKPFHISEKIVIKPTWEEYASDANEHIIELDPGMAFGTGTHETTEMCARFLEKYLQPEDVVIDAGCGSGILSIIAVKLGARKVTAFDVDSVAVRVTRENCSLNGVEEKIDAVQGVLADMEPMKADIVVANIIANVIVDISPLIPHYLKPGGLFVTSGIIKERKEDVLKAYEKQGFICLDTDTKGEWVAMVLKCPDFS